MNTPLSPVQILIALQSGYKLSRDLSESSTAKSWIARCWVWLKKQVGFATSYKVNEITHEILKQVLKQVSPNKDELETLEKLLLELKKRVIKARSCKSSPALQQTVDKVIKLVDCVARFQASGVQLSGPLKNWQNAYEATLAAVKAQGLNFHYASDEMKADLHIVKAAVTQNGSLLQEATSAMRSDRAIVVAAISNDGLALQYAHSNFAADLTIVLPAVTQNGMALQYAHADLRNNRDVVLAAVKQNPEALQFASEQQRTDIEIIEAAALQQSGLALRHAAESAKGNSILMKKILSQKPGLIRLLGDKLGSDIEYILSLAEQKPEIISEINPAFLSNLPFLLRYVKLVPAGKGYLLLPTEQRDNPTLALAALKAWPEIWVAISEQLKADPLFMAEAVKLNGLYLKEASIEIRNNLEIVALAVQSKGLAIEFALKHNPQILELAIAQDGAALKFAPASYAQNKAILAKALLSHFEAAIAYLSDELRNDSAFLLEVSKKRPEILYQASKELKNSLFFKATVFASHPIIAAQLWWSKDSSPTLA